MTHIRPKEAMEWDECPTIRFIRDIERKAPGFIDHTGTRLGRLTVLGRAMKYAGNAFGGALWICRCDCGRFVARRHKAILKSAPDNACSQCAKETFHGKA